MCVPCSSESIALEAFGHHRGHRTTAPVWYFSGCSYLEMARAACSALASRKSNKHVSLLRVFFVQPMLLPDDPDAAGPSGRRLNPRLNPWLPRPAGVDAMCMHF